MWCITATRITLLITVIIPYSFFRLLMCDLQDLREAFENEDREPGSERLLLFVAVAAGKQAIDDGYEIEKLAK